MTGQFYFSKKKDFLKWLKAFCHKRLRAFYNILKLKNLTPFVSKVLKQCFFACKHILKSPQKSANPKTPNKFGALVLALFCCLISIRLIILNFVVARILTIAIDNFSSCQQQFGNDGKVSDFTTLPQYLQLWITL